MVSGLFGLLNQTKFAWSAYDAISEMTKPAVTVVVMSEIADGSSDLCLVPRCLLAIAVSLVLHHCRVPPRDVSTNSQPHRRIDASLFLGRTGLLPVS